MTGLDKIIQEIEQEAAKAAAETLRTAEEQAAQQAQQTIAGAEATAAEIQARAQAQAADILRSGESAIALRRRQQTLELKQTLLEQTMAATLQALQTLPAEEYFALLLRLAAKNAEASSGTLLLAAQDMQRLPANFEAQLAQVLPQGGSLTLQQADTPFNGGFVLQYGEVEQNCTFAAILAAGHDDYCDAIRTVFFS